MTELPEKLPQKLILEITPKCNFKCPFCYCLWHEYPELARHVLTLSDWKKVIDEVVRKGVTDFLFTGGELLLFKEWRQLILHAREKLPNGKLEIFTNGSRITDDDLLFLKENCVRLSSSLQGLRTYGEMTGTKRKFYKTVDLIDKCCELKIPCAIGITVTRRNIFEIEDIVSAAAFAGAEVIQVGVCMNAGRAKDNAELLLTENEWQLIKEKIKKLSLSRAVVFCEEFECKCMTDSQFNCPAADNSFGVISPNGIYRKCLHYYEKNI